MSIEIKHYGTFDISIGDKSISLRDDNPEYVCVDSVGEFTGEEVAMIVSDIVASRRSRVRTGMHTHEKDK